MRALEIVISQNHPYTPLIYTPMHLLRYLRGGASVGKVPHVLGISTSGVERIFGGTQSASGSTLQSEL